MRTLIIEPDQQSPLDESKAEATRILSEAGWIADEGWGGYFHGRCVGGLAPDGNFYVKNLDIIRPGHPKYGPDTPDEFHEAAAWLAAQYKAPHSAEHEPDPGNAPGPELSEHASDGDGGPDLSGEGAGASASDAGEGDDGRAADVPEDADRADGSDHPIDADFEPIPDLPEIELIPPDGDPDFGAELLEFEGELSEPKAQETAQGPIAYAASDFDALIREKTGRVSQIARGLKAEMQEGWTLDEYASLQNQIVMMDRGQMPDNPAARERFVFISQKSQAMSRVDAVRDGKEETLDDIGRRRNYPEAEAFDPESDWP